MRRPVVLEVAALTKRCQVSWVVVAGVLVEMRRSEYDKGCGQGRGHETSQRRLPRSKLGQVRQCPRSPALVVAPALFVRVPPETVRSDDNVMSMWPPAALAVGLTLNLRISNQRQCSRPKQVPGEGRIAAFDEPETLQLHPQLCRRRGQLVNTCCGDDLFGFGPGCKVCLSSA